MDLYGHVEQCAQFLALCALNTVRDGFYPYLSRAVQLLLKKYWCDLD